MTEETLALPAPEEQKLLPAPERPKRLPPPRSAGPGDNRGGRVRVVLIALAVIVLLLLIGWFFHHRRESAAEHANKDERDLIPTVGAVAAKSSPPTSDLRLPGSVSPLTEASLFARSSGYLSVRYVDIGDTVHRGQVMAEVESPDLDQEVLMARQQLDAARSAVNDAKARVALSQVSYDRLAELVKDQAVAQQQVDQGRQDLDTARAGVVSSVANVGAGQANLQRLIVLQGYEKVRAPFDGVVTARNVDVGSLINASGANAASSSSLNSTSTSSTSSASGGSSSSGATATQNTAGTASTELFRIAQVDRVRVFVTVPQENAASVEPDTEANVFVQGFDRPFEGMVTRTAQSLDPSARTLLTEVQVPNPQHRLVAGMYAQVAFRSPRRGTPLLVPGEAVMARADGLSVAVLQPLSDAERARLPKPDPGARKRREKAKADASQGDAGDAKKSGGDADQRSGKGGDDHQAKGDGANGGEDDQDPSKARRVHLQRVEVGRDYGTEIEIASGLAPGATIVANPGDEVKEGAIVIARLRSTGKSGDPKDGKPQGGTSPDGSPQGFDTPPQGIGSPSMQAPTKGRK